MYEPDSEMVNPIKTNGLSTEKSAGILVLGALLFLIAINRGFRGLSVSRATGGLVNS